jgi:hypothetical protein
MGNFVVGLDLGQAQDYTALCVVEHLLPKADAEEDPPFYLRDLVAAPLWQPNQYHCRHLQRFKLGTRYPEIVSEVANILRSPQLRGAALVVDGTGVGRAVIDMFVDAELNPIAISITGGDTVTRDGSYYRVPKRDLVGAVQVPLQDKRLKFADSLRLVPTLIEEMLAFRVKITDTAHDTYGAWREGQHDDLILAVMMAVWWLQWLEKSVWSPGATAQVLSSFGWQG